MQNGNEFAPLWPQNEVFRTVLCVFVHFQELYRVLLTAEAEGLLSDMRQEELKEVERILLQGCNKTERMQQQQEQK